MEKLHDHKLYLRLAGMTILSFIAMYILMYAMADSIGSVFNNINQVYMASPMVIMELVLMRAMYPSIRTNQVTFDRRFNGPFFCSSASRWR